MSKNTNNPWVSRDEFGDDWEQGSNDDYGSILNNEFGWSKRRPRLLKFDWSEEDLNDWYF